MNEKELTNKIKSVVTHLQTMSHNFIWFSITLLLSLFYVSKNCELLIFDITKVKNTTPQSFKKKENNFINELSSFELI